MGSLLLAATLPCLVVDQSGDDFAIVVMEERAATLPWRLPEGLRLCPAYPPAPASAAWPELSEDLVLRNDAGGAR